MEMFNNEIKKKEVIKKTPAFYLNEKKKTKKKTHKERISFFFDIVKYCIVW